MATTYTNEDFAIAQKALGEIAKLGPKDNKVIRRLTQAILTCGRVLKAYTQRSDITLDAWTEKDDAGKIKLREITEGPQKGEKSIVFTNFVEYQKAMKALNAEVPEIAGEMMKPFTFNEFFKDADFKTLPDAEQIARLGPFYSEE